MDSLGCHIQAPSLGPCRRPHGIMGQPSRCCRRPRTSIRLHAMSMEPQPPSINQDWGSGIGNAVLPTQGPPAMTDRTGEIHVLGMTFDQRSAKAYISSRLHGYFQGERVQAEDEALLRYLLKFHHDCASKEGSGISHFSVTVHPKGTTCFQINRVDGTYEDFSYVKCLKVCFWMHEHGLVNEEGLPAHPPPDVSAFGRYLPPPAPGTAVPSTLPDDMLNNWQQNLDADSGYPGQQGWGSPLDSQANRSRAWNPTASGSMSSGDQDAWGDQPFATESYWSLDGGSSGPGPAEWAPPAHTSPGTSPGTAPDVQLSGKEYMLAFKAAIAVNLKQFKEMMMFATSGASGIIDTDPVTCGLTGQAIRDAGDAAVGHAPEAPFKQLVVDWMRSQGFTNKGQVAVGYVQGVRHPVMLNPAQMASWRSYHASYAQLVMISKQAARAQRSAPQ